MKTAAHEHPAPGPTNRWSSDMATSGLSGRVPEIAPRIIGVGFAAASVFNTAVVLPPVTDNSPPVRRRSVATSVPHRLARPGSRSAGGDRQCRSLRGRGGLPSAPWPPDGRCAPVDPGLHHGAAPRSGLALLATEPGVQRGCGTSVAQESSANEAGSAHSQSLNGRPQPPTNGGPA